jgi:hypothetical protein
MYVDPLSMSKKNTYYLKLILFLIIQFIIFYCSVGVHCGIYKNIYNISNISYFNSPPPSFSFFSSSLHFWNSFSRYHFSIYMHVYTIFTLYSTYVCSFPISFLLPLVPTPPTQKDLFCFPVLWFCKRKTDIFACSGLLYREFPCSTYMYVYIYMYIYIYIYMEVFIYIYIYIYIIWIGSSPLFFFSLP